MQTIACPPAATEGRNNRTLATSGPSSSSSAAIVKPLAYQSDDEILQRIWAGSMGAEMRQAWESGRAPVRFSGSEITEALLRECQGDSFRAASILNHSSYGQSISPLPASRDDFWEHPIPLEGQSAAPCMPASVLDALPSWASDLVCTSAEAHETAVDLGVIALMSTLSVLALGRMEIKTFDRYAAQPSNLSAIIMVQPGGGKSQTLKRFTVPLDILEAERLESARRAYARYLAERKVMETRRAALEKKAAQGDEDAMAEVLKLAEDEAREIPVPRGRIVNQATPEALAEIAVANEGTFALLTAETEGLSSLLPVYRDGPKLVPEVVLSAFDGAPVRQARVNAQRNREIESCNGALLIMAQQEQLMRVLSEPTFRESGFLSRCILSAPRLPARSGDPREGRGVPEHIARAYCERILDLGRWFAQLDHLVRITFSTAALDQLAALHGEMNARRDSPGGDLQPIALATVRVEMIAARVAGLLHLARHGERANEIPVEEDIAAAAADLGRYHAGMALAILGESSPAVEVAVKILRYARQHGDPFRCEWRAIHQAFRRSKEWAVGEEALYLIEAHHLARLVEEPAGAKGGRPRKYLELSPRFGYTEWGERLWIAGADIVKR